MKPAFPFFSRRRPMAFSAAAIALCLGTIVLAVPAPTVHAQEREDRTLLSGQQMRAIINEASGERALHHVLELVPYPRVRPASEYQGPFRESAVMARYAREYSYSGVEIESFPTQGRDWQASEGQLWMVEPEQRKLYDIYDVAISLCPGSETGDVTAELVSVGDGGRAEDYEGKDVRGKIVLGSARTAALQRMAVFERGAAGIISYDVLFPDDQPDISLSQSLASRVPKDKHAGFGWAVSARVGRELARRLEQGETIKLRSIVKAQTFPGRLEVVHAVIPGDGSTDQAIMVSAHLYEGYIKQGANDDNSGCAVTLEMGRALLRLVAEGKLPRPKRTIHFLWVPEIRGTAAWLEKHEDIRKKLIADLNFDMEGLGLARGGSFWVLLRTPDSFPSYLNDVTQSVLEFVAQTNRQRVRYRAHGYRSTLPVLAPNGSRDPFYTYVSKHYGASDHVVYLNQGIPAIIFSTWPDPWYHSSQDTPDKLDSTQFKRAAVVGLASMSILASADDVMAARVTAESLGRGTERMGEAERKGLSYLADSPANAAALGEAYKEALNAVRHQTDVEKQVVGSSEALYSDFAAVKSQLSEQERLMEKAAAMLRAEIGTFYWAQADRARVQPAEPAQTEAEKQAARLYPEREPGGEGFGALRQALGKLSPEERKAAEDKLEKVPQHMTAELGVLLGKKMSVLEIRDFLSGEFEPLPLSDLMENLRTQEKLGLVKLIEKAAEPAAPVKKAKRSRKKP